MKMNIWFVQTRLFLEGERRLQMQIFGEERQGFECCVVCNSAHQWMLESDHGLAPPLGLQHVGEIFGAGAEDAAVRVEHLAVHRERHVAVRALLQQPARRHRRQTARLFLAAGKEEKKKTPNNLTATGSYGASAKVNCDS